MKTDKDGYEIRTYRVIWSVRIGTIGDSEGRTWGAVLSEDKFPTQVAAELYRDTHPDLYLDRWGFWRPKADYGICGIFRVEELIEENEI